MMTGVEECGLVAYEFLCQAVGEWYLRSRWSYFFDGDEVGCVGGEVDCGEAAGCYFGREHTTIYYYSVLIIRTK